VQVRVEERGVTDEQWASSRARELFFLFLSRPAGLRKEQAVECLYPDLPASRCNSAFHSNLYRVRKALYHESIVKQDGLYALNPGGTFEWDVADFESCLARAEKLAEGSGERAEAYEEALRLYQGPFAEAFESEWAAALRDRLEQRFIETLSRLAGYHAGRGHHETAATLLRRMLESDPYDEQAAYALARAQVGSGHGVAALQLLDDYAKRVRDDLGVLPGRRLIELREAIAAGRAG
jgi:two-component SAPR family response regulator